MARFYANNAFHIDLGVSSYGYKLIGLFLTPSPLTMKADSVRVLAQPRSVKNLP